MDFIDVYIDDISMRKKFHLIRTADGGGFSMKLSPAFNIKTLTLPSSDTWTVLGREKSEDSLQIKLVTEEGLKESELKELKNFLYNGNKAIIEDSNNYIRTIAFDEIPILKQKIIFSQAPQFDFNVFEEHDYRIYRGFITLSYKLVSPYRFYESTNKNLKEFLGNTTDNTIYLPENILEWYEIYGQWDIHGNNKNSDTNSLSQDNHIIICNPGQINSPLTLEIQFDSLISNTDFSFVFQTTEGSLSDKWTVTVPKDSTGLRIDGKHMLAMGLIGSAVKILPYTKKIPLVPAGIINQDNFYKTGDLIITMNCKNLKLKNISYDVLYL